jgi:hypothetical protein
MYQSVLNGLDLTVLCVCVTRKLYQHVVLNGNCVSMFEDRLSDIEIFPLCELLEEDVNTLSVDLSYNHIGDYGASALARMIQSNHHMKHLSLKVIIHWIYCYSMDLI